MVQDRSSVTVYTTPTCPYCIMIKTFLKERGVPFVEKNVAEDRAAANEMVEKSGQMAVPVVDVNGEIIVGFNQDAIKKALKI